MSFCLIVLLIIIKNLSFCLLAGFILRSLLLDKDSNTCLPPGCICWFPSFHFKNCNLLENEDEFLIDNRKILFLHPFS